MDNLDLIQFNKACDDFILGKYILADLKVKTLMRVVNNSEKLTALISSSLEGLDFGLAFKESVTSNGLVLPNGTQNIIAYCFNILYNLNEGTFTFLDFLSKYFSSAKLSGGEEFASFASTIIEPFKNAVNIEYKNVYEMTCNEDCQNNLYHKLEGVAKANLNLIDEIKLKEIEKEELALLLDAMLHASRKNDKKTVYAIMVGLDYFTKYNKRAKDIYLQLKDCFTRN